MLPVYSNALEKPDKIPKDDGMLFHEMRGGQSGRFGICFRVVTVGSGGRCCRCCAERSVVDENDVLDFFAHDDWTEILNCKFN